MRELADAERIRSFMRALGEEAENDATCYLTGGATAVLLGWRHTTIDVDVKLVPEQDRLLRSLPRIKDELRVNVELASPMDFIPVPKGWEERSPFETREQGVTFRHFDPYSQALAKLERAHAQDLEDVRRMLEMGLVERARALAYFAEVEPELYRYPAVDPRAFRRRAEETLSPS
jgi:Nucleotidyltransferase of unknown function (DUF6036)